MRPRVTIIMDPQIQKQLHKLQAHLISVEDGSVSFSRVCNDVLRKGLK